MKLCKDLLLLIGLIALTTSFPSCKHTFRWTPHTYSADHAEQYLIDREGHIIPFEDEGIEDFLCFPSENIAELAAQIEFIRNKKVRRKLRKLIKTSN